MKKILAIALILCLLFCQAAWAATCERTVSADLTFSRRMAYCSVTVIVMSDYDLTMELWNNGYILDTWHKTGTIGTTITEMYPAVHGETYTLKVYGTADGQTVNCTPITRTY